MSSTCEQDCELFIHLQRVKRPKNCLLAWPAFVLHNAGSIHIDWLQSHIYRHKTFLITFSFLFVTEHTACEVVRWGLLYLMVEVLMTGRFDKRVLYNFFILFKKIRILVFQYRENRTLQCFNFDVFHWAVQVSRYICSHYRVISKQSQGKDGWYLQASFHYTHFINVYEIMNIFSLKQILQFV